MVSIKPDIIERRARFEIENISRALHNFAGNQEQQHGELHIRVSCLRLTFDPSDRLTD